jgi:hypothetical protein
MDKVIDFLQKEYGIKEDERYYIIIFKSEQHNEKIQNKRGYIKL